MIPTNTEDPADPAPLPRHRFPRAGLKLTLCHSVDRELAARLIREARRINTLSQWRKRPSWQRTLDTAATLALAECAMALDADEEALEIIYDHLAQILECCARRGRH